MTINSLPKTSNKRSGGKPRAERQFQNGPRGRDRQDKSGKRAESAEETIPATLADRAYSELEELIVTLKLPPGTVLGEQVLAQKLNIGRTPIREALQRLARDGLVVVLPRRGILVSEINVRTHLRLLETRRVIEVLMARLAAERATEAERRLFASISHRMRAAAKANDDISFMRHDSAFNELLAATARNEFAVRSLSTMSALSRRFWYQHYKVAADLPLTAKLHADVCDAIASANATEAGAATDRLISYIESFARKTLDM